MWPRHEWNTFFFFNTTALLDIVSFDDGSSWGQLRRKRFRWLPSSVDPSGTTADRSTQCDDQRAACGWLQTLLLWAQRMITWKSWVHNTKRHLKWNVLQTVPNVTWRAEVRQLWAEPSRRPTSSQNERATQKQRRKFHFRWRLVLCIHDFQVIILCAHSNGPLITFSHSLLLFHEWNNTKECETVIRGPLLWAQRMITWNTWVHNTKRHLKWNVPLIFDFEVHFKFRC